MATKLDLLLSYAPARVRDTWVALGSATVPSTNKVFMKNSLFKLDATGTPLHNYYILVLEDYSTSTAVPWLVQTLSDPATGLIVDDNQVYHPAFRVVMTAAEYSAIVDPLDTAFVPFTEATSDVVIIDDSDYTRIMVDLGAPFIKDEELEFTKEEILSNMLWPAMMEYFKWYPITQVETFPMNSPSFEIPIPEGAYTALKAYVNNGYPVGAIANPLNRYFDELLVSGAQGIYPVSSSYSGRRRGFMSPDSYSTFVMERAVRQSMMNYSTKTRIRVKVQDGIVKGYSTKRGILEIEWAYASNVWNDIPFNRQSEVRDLAKANVLRSFAMLRSQARASDIQGTLNYDGMLSRATDLETKVVELWQSATKGVVIR